jgi:hypothetical protein
LQVHYLLKYTYDFVITKSPEIEILQVLILQQC